MKVRFFFRFVKHHKMKRYGNMEVYFHSFLNSAQDGGGARVKDLLVPAGQDVV